MPETGGLIPIYRVAKHSERWGLWESNPWSHSSFHVVSLHETEAQAQEALKRAEQLIKDLATPEGQEAS